MAFYRLLIGCMLIGRSVAGSLEDFSNNLVSDLGPLLSLFGDSMAKQFLSESTTFLDYIIFAIAPIGIITAIVSAIRLCGSAALRAFIGRSQEGQGAVEAELCTSTSRDVCELFTRGGIQRVLGTPHILELIYIPRTETSNESQLLLSRDYFTERARAADSPWKLIKGGSSRPEDNANNRTTLAPNPNLSLNIGIRRPPQWLLWIIATSGLFLQAGVLVLSGVGVWIFKWNPSEGTIAVKTDRAAVLFISGTVLMVAGMWGCAFLIGQTTHEVCFQRKTSQGKSRQPQLLWLQPGRQVIGDQSFDPFAYLEGTGERSLQTWMSSRKISAKHFELFTYLSVLATVVGYIVQFIGLRGLKVWVAVAQLSLTVVMSCVRGLLRAQRLGTNDNELRDMPDMVAGHELDWLSFRLDPHMLVNKPSWHITGQHEQARDTTVPANNSEANSTHESKPTAQIKTSSSLRTTTTKPITRSTSSSSISSDSNNDDLLQIRLRLAHLTGLHSIRGVRANHTLTWDDQHVKVRTKARQLSHAIGMAATNFFLRSSAERNNAVELHVRAASRNDIDKGQRVGITLRPPLEFSQAGWHLDPAQVEAILGLWTWTMTCELTASESKSAQDLDIPAIESLAENIPIARIVSFGVDGPQWEDETNYQGEMDLWLGRSAIKFRQSTMKLTAQNSYGLATIFSQSGKDQHGDWEAQGPDHTPPHISRYAGWNGAHRVLAAAQTQSQGSPDKKENATAKFRLQVTQVSQDTSSLLDICCQELFVALIVSLLEYDNVPIGDATFVESGGLLRLEHPTASIFADAFVESELGTYADALLCIVPALRSTLPSLNPETMLPALARTADTYRRESQWARAEKVLAWACARTNNKTTSNKHFEYSLRAICELYRWSLSAFSDTERNFGLKGLESIIQTYSSVGTNHAGIKSILDSYQEIARRFKNGDADKDRGRGMPSCFKANQQQLLYSLRWGKRTEALYYICLLTPESLQESVIPESALSLAARNNWVEVVDVLLKMKARPNDRDDFGYEIKSGIFHCAELGNDECARILLDHGASLDDTIFKSGSRHTLFTVAARNGHLNMIELLLDRGCKDLDQTDSKGNSPLAIAAECGHTKIVETLLKTGKVNLDREVQIRGTPLEIAGRSNHVDIVKLLLDAARMQLGQKDRNWGVALWWAASHGNEEGVKDFLDGGANIEFKDELFQQTALARAVVQGQIAVVQQLLQRGADANTQDNTYKNTPLMEASFLMYDSPSVDEDPEKAKEKKQKSKVSKAIAELLIAKGAKLELQNKKGLSALAVTAQKGHIMCLELLLAKGADIESKDLKKHTPLMHAVKYHRRGAIRMLLRNGANLEARDAKGKTPLFHAFNNGAVGGSDNQNTLDLLIRKGADVTAKDNEGYTALMRVEQWEKAKSVRTEQWEKIKPGRVPPSEEGGNDADGRGKEARESKRRGSWGGM